MDEPQLPASKHAKGIRKILAWCVHCYTGLGLVAAMAMAWLLTVRPPDGEAFRWAFVLMFAATLIDATDGTLARWVKVKEVLPGFDGRRLDDLIDFLNYTCLPLFLLWRADIFPDGHAWWLLLPLLASAYGFCQVSVKTADGYFLGFPSYWNIAAFYLYFLDWPRWLALTAIIVLSLLTFVPTRYLYPSQRGSLNRLTNALGAVWAGFLAWILMTSDFPTPSASSAPDGHVRQFVLISLFFPAYYLLASWLISLKLWLFRRRRGTRPTDNHGSHR
jgi:phosphatidylcholine synthase